MTMTLILTTGAVTLAGIAALARAIVIRVRRRHDQDAADLAETESWWEELAEPAVIPAALAAGTGTGADWVRETCERFPPGWLELYDEMTRWLENHASPALAAA